MNSDEIGTLRHCAKQQEERLRSLVCAPSVEKKHRPANTFEKWEEKMTSQQSKAKHLLNMHQKGVSLLLPNALDAASARLFEQAGFPAIGTTSSGIAFAYETRDGEQMSRQDMMDAIAQIVGSVQVPVTADIEAGYGETPEEVARIIRGHGGGGRWSESGRQYRAVQTTSCSG